MWGLRRTRQLPIALEREKKRTLDEGKLKRQELQRRVYGFNKREVRKERESRLLLASEAFIEEEKCGEGFERSRGYLKSYKV